MRSSEFGCGTDGLSVVNSSRCFPWRVAARSSTGRSGRPAIKVAFVHRRHPWFTYPVLGDGICAVSSMAQTGALPTTNRCIYTVFPAASFQTVPLHQIGLPRVVSKDWAPGSVV
jgi:hypothetical protein